MEHPPKQGLKREEYRRSEYATAGFNGTSTKTRIETCDYLMVRSRGQRVLMEHPPKQGLKLAII